MRFIDLFHKGYVLLDITRDRLQGEFWHLATITERRREERLAAAYFTTRGNNHLEAARGASAPGALREPAA
jgi:alkaline phosphatase D